MNPNQGNADAQYEKMVNTPVWKLVTVLAIPTIISMLITAIYNTADTFSYCCCGCKIIAIKQ